MASWRSSDNDKREAITCSSEKKAAKKVSGTDEKSGQKRAKGTPHLFQLVLPLLQLEVGGDGRVFSRKVGVALSRRFSSDFEASEKGRCLTDNESWAKSSVDATWELIEEGVEQLDVCKDRDRREGRQSSAEAIGQGFWWTD